MTVIENCFAITLFSYKLKKTHLFVIFFYSKSTFLNQSDQQINGYFNTIIITPFYNYYIKCMHSCSERT